MIKNVLPSLRQRDGPQRICSRQKSIRSGTARDSFSQTPHMRGKVVYCVVYKVACGITPAYAGKRATVVKPAVTSWDHPRVCGEKERLEITVRAIIGSPPRMRGKGLAHSRLLQLSRITPAYAGKSCSASGSSSVPRDHPRVCGEKITLHIRANVSLGSPPHMRGKGKEVGQELQTGGITPAYAGKRAI